MRQIVKTPLSESTQNQLKLKIDNGKQYANITSKQYKSVRNQLFKEQKYICCYCECLIWDRNNPPPNMTKAEIDKLKPKENVHIEHFYEQDDYAIHGVHSLDYMNNMIASCQGDRDKMVKDDAEIKQVETEEERQLRIKNTSCGHKKEKDAHQKNPVDYKLLLNPHESVSHLFSYGEGYISASNLCNEDEKQKVDYTIERLALDASKLFRRRRQAIEIMQYEISDISNQNDKIVFINAILDETKDRLNPYFSTLKDNFRHLII